MKMTNFNTILNDLFAAEDKTEYIRSLNGYELLIIDDLGVERNSEYALENIFSVIDLEIPIGKTFDYHNKYSFSTIKTRGKDREEKNLLTEFWKDVFR